MIKSIPVYYYQNNVQKGQAKLQITIDHDVYEQYKNVTYPAALKDWQNVTVTNLADFLNSDFGFPLITRMTDYYIGMASGNVMASDFVSALSLMGISTYHFITGLTRSDETRGYPNITYQSLNGYTFNHFTVTTLGYIQISDSTHIQWYLNSATNPTAYYDYININLSDHTGFLAITVFDEGFFTDNGTIAVSCPGVQFRIGLEFNNDWSAITRIRIVTASETSNQLYTATDTPFNLNGAQDEDEDPDNPYGPLDPGADPNGGDYPDPDGIDKTEVPDLPTLGATDFITIYNPSAAALNSFANFLWSDLFDLDTFKKVTQNPFDCIIGLNIVPCVPASMGSKHIKLGNIDTEVTSNYCSTQWVKVQCGGVNIKTMANSFMDYSPHVKINLFLPFIGFEPLSADDVMGGSISVTYHVDVVSGDLVCFVYSSSKGVLYCYNGNCAAHIPVSQGNYGGALKNYYQQIASIVPAMANGAMMGGAAGAAAGGITQAFSATGSILFNNKPDIQHGGSMSGAAGVMGVKKPFIIIERPNISVPGNVSKYAGLSSNKTVKLGNVKGYTQVDYVHIDNVTATSEEIAEIERLLHEGVIL